MTQSNYLPPLEPIGDFRSYVCGDVVIDETAAIASGVLIQADLGSRITIAAGVCIGMGAVIHAQSGLLEICAGANLGAGVLVYGTSKIGEGCCIGASSSIVRAEIAKGAIVPPCSLIANQVDQAIKVDEEKIPDSSPNRIFNDVTATSNSFVADSIDPVITETQNNISNNFISEVLRESAEVPDVANVGNKEQNSQIEVAGAAMESDISALVNANSAQAKAYAQSQINRFIKRLYPQN